MQGHLFPFSKNTRAKKSRYTVVRITGITDVVAHKDPKVTFTGRLYFDSGGSRYGRFVLDLLKQTICDTETKTTWQTHPDAIKDVVLRVRLLRG